ncbi:hypothetical protein NDU88_007506 [Pleurodeles waltl]|uniref:Uncharacterized protein n=1 Tax=Pleurodeles waltl TaxID=8319 RepID=A0AAV7N283_PLEWA|nr:hypothetical protein NDU88_007506 [Pleurodeles waltl]
MSNTCADSAHGVPDTPRSTGLPIGSPKCPREGGAIIRTAGIMPGRPFQRRRAEELTGKRTTGAGEEHEGAEAGDFRLCWEEDGSEDPIPSRSRPLDDDCWPRGAHAYDLPRFRRSVAKSGTKLNTGKRGGGGREWARVLGRENTGTSGVGLELGKGRKGR